jgi:hypothetical protein
MRGLSRTYIPSAKNTRTVVGLERTLVGEKAIQVAVPSEGGFIPKPELVITATASIPFRDQVAPETAR